MAKDLRSFVDQLARNFPGQLVEIETPVQPAAFEATGLVDVLARRGLHPALLFNNVSALDGSRWPGRFVINIDPGTFFRAAVATGLDPHTATSQQVVNALAAGAASPVQPVVIPRDAAPVKENVWVGSQADLRKLPLLMHYGGDTRPGWCTPIVAMAHPETGRYNLSYHRTLYKSPHQAVTAMRDRHPQEYLTAAARLGRTLPVAMILGHHPCFYQGVAMRSPWAVDEYEVVCGVMGEPLRLTPSETWGDALMVPADAEIIIEGEVHPDILDLEAPFGEWSRYYGPQSLGPVVDVRAITFRRGAIFQAVRTSYHIIEDIAHSAGLLTHLQARFPRVVSACSLFHTWAIIALDKRYEGEPFRLASYAFGYGNHVKHVIVVDKDIDPFNLRDVFWALGVRMQPHVGLQILKDLEANLLDPSTLELRKGSVTLIDATEPVDRPYQRLVQVPPPVRERLGQELERYIPRAALIRIPHSDPWQL